MSTAELFLLKCSVQNYEWGKIGKDSEVARLASGSDKDLEIKENVPYAELWMGTHPKGPSVIHSTGEPLAKWIEKHPESLGTKARLLVADSVGQLPFLFKVLSVNKSLSIQIHPNKEDAEHLHKENPKEYPDSNHKPEMAIALTPFEALCGFRPKAEIVDFLQSIPELRFVIGESNAAEICKESSKSDQAALKKCFTALMSSCPEVMSAQLSCLLTRVQHAKACNDTKTLTSCLGDLFLRLHDQFPGDVGCFAIYFLNFIKLKVGDAIFLEAGLPHAYLDGDCIECMACSDNVVRAGLTPKFKDVATLCRLLKYHYQNPQDLLFKGSRTNDDPYTTVFNPPIPDFCVHQIQLPAEVQNYVIKQIDGASILLVIEGSADATSEQSDEKTVHLERGSVLFLPANHSAKLRILNQKPTLIYRATCVGSD